MEAESAENQPVGQWSELQRVTIGFFSTEQQSRQSEQYKLGPYTYQLSIIPKGWYGNGEDLSIYLAVVNSESKSCLLSKKVKFRAVVVNEDPAKSVTRETEQLFSAHQRGIGFYSFIPLEELRVPASGFLRGDGSLIVDMEIEISQFHYLWSYDSKNETGFVGLKNQGATAYLNSLIQVLFHIKGFREFVYRMEIVNDKMLSALKRLFYNLENSITSVGTEELTESFGWNKYDSFTQHDVQELNTVLREKLMLKVKVSTRIKCRSGLDFGENNSILYDVQLQVKECLNIDDSFKKDKDLVEKLMSSKNLLPAVLQLQLNRFNYDSKRDIVVKIDDRYEFPRELDLGRYLLRDGDVDSSGSLKYTLYGVLAHHGGVPGGHYHVLIRPNLSTQWYKFNDEEVTEEDPNAVDELYGGYEEVTGEVLKVLKEIYRGEDKDDETSKKFSKYSAYILVYVRENSKEELFCNVDVPAHLNVNVEADLPPTQRQVAVQFKPLNGPKDEDDSQFPLYMSELESYNKVVELLGKRISANPLKIRLTGHNNYSQQPKPWPIEPEIVKNLSDMFDNISEVPHVLYYEKLEFTLTELQDMKTFEVIFHPAKVEPISHTKDKDRKSISHTISLSKDSKVRDLLDRLMKDGVVLSHPDDVQLRLLEIVDHFIVKTFSPNESIQYIDNQFCTLRAEEIPLEERNLDLKTDCLIRVHHFFIEKIKPETRNIKFGEPFYLKIQNGETFGEVKNRLRERLTQRGIVSEENFSKLRFKWISLGEKFDLTDLAPMKFDNNDQTKFLGINHCKIRPKRRDLKQFQPTFFEKPVKIKD